jgi:NAD(P)H-nitrite reductase large subunit
VGGDVSRRTVIVGAGQAGARTAAALRKLDNTADITLLGEEQDLPYERPPLSKEVLNGGSPSKATLFPRTWYEEHRIALRTGVHVTGFDWRAKQISLAHGESLAYDDLVLATGVRPRPLIVPGATLDGVLTLRTIGDSAAHGRCKRRRDWRGLSRTRNRGNGHRTTLCRYRARKQQHAIAADFCRLSGSVSVGPASHASGRRSHRRDCRGA